MSQGERIERSAVLMRHRALLPLSALLFAWCGTVPAEAQTSFRPAYEGAVFVIRRADRAPWAAPDDEPVASDIRRLIGRRIIFRPQRIDAPHPLGCARPSYEVKDYSADRLFEGDLTQPGVQAAALGFRGAAIPTLIPGCEIEFHFLDADTALFGLNDSVYRIERVPAKKGK
jgi:hypothetical protein